MKQTEYDVIEIVLKGVIFYLNILLEHGKVSHVGTEPTS